MGILSINCKNKKKTIKLDFYFDIYFDMIGFRYRINMDWGMDRVISSARQ